MLRRLFCILLLAVFLPAACETGGGTPPSTGSPPEIPGGDPEEPDDYVPPDEEWGAEEPSGGGGGGGPAPDPGPPRPSLESSDIVYDGESGAVRVVFTFNVSVNITVSDGWTAAGNHAASIAVTPSEGAPFGPSHLSFTAANIQDDSKSLNFAGRTVVIASGVFKRPVPPETAEPQTAVYYDEKYGAAGLVPDGGTDTEWVCVNDEGLRRILKAASQSGATELFHITAAESATGDRVEIRGDELPQKPAYGYAVIDIGQAKESKTDNNALLPAFTVPFRALGEENEENGKYGHIRLRVNRNARLVIESENNGDHSGYGYLSGAFVEVAAGGSLVCGSRSGFPLGKDSAVISRLNSSLAAGSATDWIIGPASRDPVIAWGAGDQNGDYIEIREGKIAFDANLTVRKTLTLAYSVWFVSMPSLTIDAAGTGPKGLFADGPGDYSFYGTRGELSGENTGFSAAEIIVRPGNTLSGGFLTMSGGGEDVTADGETVTVSNVGWNSALWGAFPDGRQGYVNWKR